MEGPLIKWLKIGSKSSYFPSWNLLHKPFSPYSRYLRTRTGRLQVYTDCCRAFVSDRATFGMGSGQGSHNCHLWAHNFATESW